MSPTRWVIATHNAGKLAEFKTLFSDLPLSLVSAGELGLGVPEETGETFLENALLKARAASAGARLPAIADDSGLLVDALNDEPGVRSARYAGLHATDEDNVDRLLGALKNNPNRRARFICVLVALRFPTDPVPLVIEGLWQGEIAQTPAGGGGFGYDPVFHLPDLGVTAAQLDKTTKNRLSHRGQAVRALKTAMEARGYTQP